MAKPRSARKTSGGRVIQLPTRDEPAIDARKLLLDNQSAPTVPTPPGLTRSESGYGDHYVGRADDLIAAGLITADQLPGLPGHNKIMRTFYAGVQVGKGSNRPHDEHYLSIKRSAGGNFEVIKGVPAQVYRKRIDAWRAERKQREAEKRAEQLRELSKEKTADDYREFCLRGNDFSWRLDGGEDNLYSFRFSDDVRQRIESLLAEIRTLIKQGSVLPLRPAAGTGSRHLRLAWSAS